ncbi:penicillin-binding protein 2 [Patescibacteria group bacterium]|nr:penicillin-binding protein 2 [Patescibacteria group bacterium]
MSNWRRDPFVIKEYGGNIKDRKVTGFSWRRLEGTTLGESGVGTLRRVISQAVPMVLAVAVALVLFIFFIKLFYLQGWQGQRWRSVAEGNRIRLEIISAQRGLITDRQGQPLIRNNSTFSVVAIPADMPRDETVRQQFLNEILASVPAEYIDKDELVDLSTFSYLPVIIAQNIPHDLALKLMVVSRDYQGLRVEPSNIRDYLSGESFAHLLGYVGKISAQQYTDLKNQGYQINDYIGQAGLEMQYEEALRGQPGKKQVEVDAFGKERKIYAAQASVPGAKLVLTVEAGLQKVAYESLKEAASPAKKGGSVVALNPQTGEILALVSYPSYNPNIFTINRDNNKIRDLLKDQTKPLFNRVLAGEYPPGSTIKPFWAAAGLKEGVITEQTTFFSSGGVRLGDQYFADWKAGGHGLVNVYKAIAESVNTFFYLLGGGGEADSGLGISRLTAYLEKFGFSQPRNIDLPGERLGFIPTPLWKLDKLNERWYKGDTYNISIGQGDLLVTPLQLAVNYSALVTNGRIKKPHLLKEIVWPDRRTQQTPVTEMEDFGLSDEILQIVQKGMRQTVTDGSARYLNSLPVKAAGKTGTAQTGSQTLTHAWFMGYAPYDKPTLLVVAMVEQGGEGSSVAVPIVRKMMAEYFSNAPTGSDFLDSEI